MKPLTKGSVHARNPGTIVLHPKVGGLIVGAKIDQDSFTWQNLPHSGVYRNQASSTHMFSLHQL